jgi:hypothetical protein
MLQEFNAMQKENLVTAKTGWNWWRVTYFKQRV